MEQKDKPWVVNYPEAVNRTCNAIYEEYKTVIELFNKKLCDACSKKNMRLVIVQITKLHFMIYIIFILI